VAGKPEAHRSPAEAGSSSQELVHATKTAPSMGLASYPVKQTEPAAMPLGRRLLTTRSAPRPPDV